MVASSVAAITGFRRTPVTVAGESANSAFTQIYIHCIQFIFPGLSNDGRNQSVLPAVSIVDAHSRRRIRFIASFQNGFCIEHSPSDGGVVGGNEPGE